jgi:hypothetical protein
MHTKINRASALPTFGLDEVRKSTSIAFTRRELIVVIAVLVVVGLILVPALRRAIGTSRSICCNCNLKQIGTAYRVWANDNGNRYPAFVPVTNGGWRDLLSRTNAGRYCWTNYAIMAENLGYSPVVLVCPSDKREPAHSISNIFANTNLSYFVGVIANSDTPGLILSGDRNLGLGTTPDAQYGFSPTNGSGNDVVINAPVCWSLKMHSRRNSAASENILLADGSAQQVTSVALNNTWLKNALEAQTAPHPSTNSPGLRLIFP